MIKRIICLILMCLTASLPVAYAASDNSSFQEDVAMLRALGILESGTGNQNSEMKRSDFLTILCKMLNYSSTDELFAAGIADGAADGGEAVTYDQAVTMLVKALGYEVKAELEGGYPAGYKTVASSIGLTKGVYISDTLTNANIVAMLCNACETDIMQIEFLTGNVIKGEDEKNLIEEYLDIYTKKGIVSEVQDVCINNAYGTQKDEVVVGGMRIIAGGIDAYDYLGMSVTAYYRQHKADDDPELVYIKADGKNKVITVSADDIDHDGTTKSGLSYFTDNSSRTKILKISPVADMVYNRRGYVNFTAEDFPVVGEVKLIDNDGDSVYDFINVKSYDTLLVDRVSAVSQMIIPQYGETLDLSGAEKYVIHNTEGEQLSLSQISRGSAVFAAVSKDREYIEIIVSDVKVSGAAASADPEEEILTVDGVEYKVNIQMMAYYAQAEKNIFEIGKNRIYVLDPYGKIAGFEAADTSDYIYAYIYRSYVDEESGKYYMVVLEEDSTWSTYEAAEKVKLNTDTIRDHNALKALINDRQLLRITLNNEGKIKKVETAKEISDGADTDYFNKITFTKAYRSPNSSFNSEYYLDGSLSIFTIPKGVDEKTGRNFSENKDNYYVSGNIFVDYGTYTVSMYDVNSNNCARIVTYERDASEKKLGSTVFLINRVAYTEKDSDILQTAEGIVAGQQLTITAEDNSLFDGLKRGDLIRFHINNDGRVDSVGVVQTARADWEVGDVLTSTLASSDPAIMKGRVEHIDADAKYMKIRGTDGTRMLKINGAYISVYNSKDNEVCKAAYSDIQVGDYAVVLASTSAIRSVTIYR